MIMEKDSPLMSSQTQACSLFSSIMGPVGGPLSAARSLVLVLRGSNKEGALQRGPRRGEASGNDRAHLSFPLSDNSASST